MSYYLLRRYNPFNTTEKVDEPIICNNCYTKQHYYTGPMYCYICNLKINVSIKCSIPRIWIQKNSPVYGSNEHDSRPIIIINKVIVNINNKN